MPARNPDAVRQRPIAAARQRTGRPATPALDPVFVELNPGALPARARSQAELYQWVRRDEEYATLGANVVVELNSESRARQPTTRARAIIRRADRSHRLTSQRVSRPDRRHADRADRTRRSHQPQERDTRPTTTWSGGCRPDSGWPFRATWRPWPSGWGYLRPRPGFCPSGPDVFRRSGRHDPRPGGLAKQEMAGRGVRGRLLVLRLGLRWVGKSGFH
jgi:hypothetical protein